MKIIYFLTGFVFSLGLALGGMLDPEKIKSFLWVLYPEEWNPSLMLVLASAVMTYAIIYWRQVKCGKSRCGVFQKIPQGKIDSKLIFGSILFGLGWGLTGLCPAPAVARLGVVPADLSTWVFVVVMFIGFKLESFLKKA